MSVQPVEGNSATDSADSTDSSDSARSSGSSRSSGSAGAREGGHNTIPVARAAEPYGAMPVQPVGLDGAVVRWVRCAVRQAVPVADRVVAELLRDGYPAAEIMLLTTGARHPGQMNSGEPELARNVFYGHVLETAEMARSVVVLAVNGFRDREQERRIRHLGMSRATELLVVCGP